MRYHLTIPARINILGNPSDANEGDYATISAAVDVLAGATVEPADAFIIESRPTRFSDSGEQILCLKPTHVQFPLAYTGELDLIKAAINRLWAYSREFRSKFLFAPQGDPAGIRLSFWSEVPRQSGLGGSSLLVLLTLAGLRQYYDLDRRQHNDYVLAELTQRTEGKELGIACGFADRYVPLFGGIAYLDYRGKLLHREIGQEPYVTYERLDPWVEDLPLIAVSTGIQHDSGDVHGRMRPRYLEEHAGWVQRGGEPPPLVRLMRGAWETAWRGKVALLEEDLVAFGYLMSENHRLVDEMMTTCGFTDGAGWANNLFIQVALENGALGAKLTGAGGGGSVFALTHPGDEMRLAEIWQDTANSYGLTSASIFRPRIARPGLRIESE